LISFVTESPLQQFPLLGLHPFSCSDSLSTSAQDNTIEHVSTNPSPLIDLHPGTALDSVEGLVPGQVILGYSTIQDARNSFANLSSELSPNDAGCVNVPDFHAEQQPQSPEYCLHHSISEKFNIRKLFESFGLFDEENSSNIVPEPSTVMQPVTSSDASEVIGSHQSLMMVDNYSTGSQYNGTPPAEVVEIGSEDTKCFSHDLPIDSDLSNNNADPDLEILENLPLKVVLSHSNFDLHPDDLGFYHYTPPPKKAKELYEAYEKGLVSLSSVQFIHKVPYEIKFSGTTLWNQMMRGSSFDVPMCDAIMRLFKSLDDQMYEAGHNGWSGDSATWRLLLPW